MKRGIMHMLKDSTARGHLDAYLRRIDQGLQGWPPDEAAELRHDLLQHIEDAFTADSAGDESERLLRALQRLGEPETFLPQAHAAHLIDAGTQGFAPLTLARGLIASSILGGKRTLMGIAGIAMILAAVTLVLIGVLAPFLPMHVGLLEFPDGTRLFGLSTRPGIQELLGAWRIPLGLGAGALLWWLLVGWLRRHARR